MKPDPVVIIAAARTPMATSTPDDRIRRTPDRHHSLAGRVFQFSGPMLLTGRTFGRECRGQGAWSVRLMIPREFIHPQGQGRPWGVFMRVDLYQHSLNEPTGSVEPLSHTEVSAVLRLTGKRA